MKNTIKSIIKTAALSTAACAAVSLCACGVGGITNIPKEEYAAVEVTAEAEEVTLTGMELDLGAGAHMVRILAAGTIIEHDEDTQNLMREAAAERAAEAMTAVEAE